MHTFSNHAHAGGDAPDAAGGGARTVLHDLLPAAARTPDAVAVVCGSRVVSYGALWRRVERWAGGLAARGIGPESLVGLSLRRSPELVVAMLAVLRAGAAYLPLERTHPASRNRTILQASRVAALITETEETLADGAGLVALSPAALDAAPSSPAPSPAPPLPSPRQLAYVLYTSGSTGEPKGVAIEHASLWNHMRWMVARFGASVGARVVQRTSCAFDASVWEFYYPLLVGGTLVLLEDEDSRDPQALRTLLVREPAATVQCVPTFLRYALDHGTFDGLRAEALFVGGEPLPTGLAEQVRRRTRALVVNLYGPTEATIDSTFAVAGTLTAHGDSEPIGMPIAGVWARPVARDLTPAAEGTLAELWIGGAGVARGYHGQPSATAQAFVPDPFGGAPGGRAYRTGDLARIDEGVLTFGGRTDRLVKLHGYRLELGEIDAVLRQDGQVRDAVTLVREVDGTPALVAYCLPRDGAGDADTDAVRAHAAARLPPYMIPARIVWLEAFPLKSNGKLDAAALPPPAPPPPAPTPASADEPLTETERALTEIYSRLFKRPVSPADDFFAIGGDSIRSIQVITLAKAQGLTLKLQDIFECPTIRALAPRVAPDPIRPAAPPFALAPDVDRARLRAMDLEDAYPTSTLLDALYVLNETSRRYEVYVTSSELGAAWDPEAFRLALTRVVARHPWLRTSFAYEGFSRPLQLVSRDVPIAWRLDDVRTLSGEAQDAHVLAWMALEKTQTFIWSEAPVWRVTIHWRADDRIQVTLSEPVFDGWSVSSCLGELIGDYAAALRGASPAAAPPPRATYRDFIQAEQETLADPASAAFWRAMIAGDPGRDLPRRREPLERRGALRRELRVSAETAARLRDIARRAAAPLKSVLLAAHVRVVAALTGRTRVASGVIVNGRAETREAEQVLGLHINTAPLTFDLGQARTWRDLIAHVFAVETSAMPHRRFPLAAIQKTHGRPPVFEAAFNFTHFHGLAEAVRRAGIPVLRYLAFDQTFFPLTAQFHVDVNDATIGLGLDYDSSELSPSQMTEIEALYRAALEQIAEAPDASCKRALWTGPAIAGVAPEADASWRDGLLARIRHIAAAQPDRVAIVSADAQVSYGALARTASALARDLRDRGITGRHVLTCFDRQDLAIVSYLAVIEAGGIYVPADPVYPPERLAATARHAAASLCLCRQQTAAALDARGLRTMPLDLASLGRRAAGTIPPPVPRPSGAAYRIYTSGSTGVPKGVSVGEGALVHFLQAMRAAVRLTADDVVAGITTIAFDISLLEMLLPLTIGARVVTVDREICRDGVRLGDALSTCEVTCCQATPTTWRMLTEAGVAFPPGLTAISGGEALTPDLAERLLARGVALYTAYGPTETTIWSAVAPVTAATGISLGAPLGATRLRVVDPFDHDCLPGTPGEIVIGGAGVADGYAGQPSLTAERFVPDPAAPGARGYRTGDRGRRSAAGAIEFLGRADDQIKLRGYRIELAEIEQAVGALPGVRDAAVKVAGADRPVLVAYVTGVDPASWDEQAAVRALSRTLPDHMIPRQWMVLDALPLTVNQKLARNRLPDPPPRARGGRRVVELLEQVKAMSRDDVQRALAGLADEA